MIMIKLLLIVSFSVFSFAESFVPLIPIYNESNKELSFQLTKDKKVIFKDITYYSKKTKVNNEGFFPYSRYVVKTSDEKCKKLTFHHRKTEDENFYYYNTYSEAALIKYDSRCKEEKIGNITFLQCTDRIKKSKNNGLEKSYSMEKYSIVFDNDEIEPSESSLVRVEKECYSKLYNLLK